MGEQPGLLALDPGPFGAERDDDGERRGERERTGTLSGADHRGAAGAGGEVDADPVPAAVSRLAIQRSPSLRESSR